MESRLDPQTRKELRELLGELGPDTLFLFASNLAVIVLALVQGWSIVPLLWIYWCQNVIIGFFNWRRMKKLTRFSVEGLKVNGERVKATEKTRLDTTRYFVLHYGLFHLFYLAFIFSVTESFSREAALSASVGVILFFFNHLFSYRYNLEKDLAATPNLGNMLFFPYLRVVPMHLIIFIGVWAGRESTVTLFFFLILKTGVDLLMHVIQHVDWGKPYDPMVKKGQAPKRMTLKQRLMLWFLLAWVAFLLLIVLAVLVMKEINR
ncbi:MAG: DUF6498-containing protein [Thermodesulfobacteriota bacterium]